MEQKKTFTIPTDKVTLSSGGQLYGDKIPPVVEVEYMITKDEDILYSSELMANGNVFKTLVQQKVKDKTINVGNLLIGDFNDILVFLRCSAYGEIYMVNTLDPDTNEMRKVPVDLTKLNRKPLTASFDEKGEFSFHLPILNLPITFSMITVDSGDYINKRAEATINRATGVKPFIKCRLETQIMSVDGERDKVYISQFVDHMPPRDRLALMNYIEEVTPGVNFDYTFTSSVKNEEYSDSIILGLDFFYPQNLD